MDPHQSINYKLIIYKLIIPDVWMKAAHPPFGCSPCRNRGVFCMWHKAHLQSWLLCAGFRSFLTWFGLGFKQWNMVHYLLVIRVQLGTPSSPLKWRTPQRPRGIPDSSVIKNPPANAMNSGLILGLGRSPGREMATHYSFLAWEIPWTEEPGRLQSMGLLKSRDMT